MIMMQKSATLNIQIYHCRFERLDFIFVSEFPLRYHVQRSVPEEGESVIPNGEDSSSEGTKIRKQRPRR